MCVPVLPYDSPPSSFDLSSNDQMFCFILCSVSARRSIAAVTRPTPPPPPSPTVVLQLALDSGLLPVRLFDTTRQRPTSLCFNCCVSLVICRHHHHPRLRRCSRDSLPSSHPLLLLLPLLVLVLPRSLVSLPSLMPSSSSLLPFLLPVRRGSAVCVTHIHPVLDLLLSASVCVQCVSLLLVVDP